MIKILHVKYPTLWLLLWIAWLPQYVAANESPVPMVIGYLELASDPRYKEQQTLARLQGQPWGRPYEAAELGLREARFAAAAAGVKFELRRHSGKDNSDLASALEEMIGQGAKLILIDAPGDTVKALAAKVKEQDVLLFNLTAPDPSLRRSDCQSNLLHIIPSQVMLSDALAQYLISKKWRKVLVLEGPEPRDAEIHKAFQRSAKRFGLKIIATKSFQLGRDPRQRHKNNVALLTSGKDYDVVFVADAQGEFAREVPYQTQNPRPVVGGAGLVPDGWIWSWERHGAPQLNKRFLRKTGRPMTAFDWSAWMAVKAIAEAVQRTEDNKIATLSEFLLGSDIVLDGFKGYPLSFRPWNNQLRQPIFLTTTNWVVARAPLEGFLHNKNDLDTLGLDQREIECDID